MREIDTALRKALKHNHRAVPALVPGLLHDVETGRRLPSTNAAMRAIREGLSRQARAADEIIKQATLLVRVLDKRQSTVHEALADRYLKPSHLAWYDDGQSPTLLRLYLPSARAAVSALLEDAERWRALVSAKLPRPGRPSNESIDADRRDLVEWVGLRLACEKIPLMTTKSGSWAQVVNVMSRALDMPGPHYRYRELRDVRTYLQQRHPNFFTAADSASTKPVPRN
jgi:hypothetical protein